MSTAGARRHEYVHAGRHDDERDDDAERPWINQRRGARAEITEEHGSRADRQSDAPVDAAAALVQPGTQYPGEEEGKERGRRRLVDREATEEREKRDQHDAADADRADQQAGERGDRRDDDRGAQ